MSDLHYGETCTLSFEFISAGNAYTFQFPFQPDKVVFYNLTQWVATAGKIPTSIWFRDQMAAANALQQKVIQDTGATTDFNFLTATTNGFTVADLPGGPSNSNCTISAITQADPCEITHSAFTFQNNQLVRITDLGPCGIVDNGMQELNNNRYLITVVDSTHITLADPITGEPIDSTGYEAYVSGGRLCLETHVISLNNPQQPPYSATNPYNPNPFVYNPVTYQLTAGTAVMGSNADVFRVEVFKYGQVINLGQLT